MLVKRKGNFIKVAKRKEEAAGLAPAPAPEAAAPAPESKEGWPPTYDEMLLRQLFKESSFNPLAESSAGAQGLAQITSITATELKRKGLVPDDFDPFNPEHAQLAQKAYMDSLLSRDWNKGSDEVRAAKALAAYNFGPTATVKVLNAAKEKGVDIYESLDWLEMLPTETSDYVSKILGYNEDWEADYLGARERFTGQKEQAPGLPAPAMKQ